jgi:hypothetical protein
MFFSVRCGIMILDATLIPGTPCAKVFNIDNDEFDDLLIRAMMDLNPL